LVWFAVVESELNHHWLLEDQRQVQGGKGSCRA